MPNNINLQIADPCHENWNTMTATEQGRYCQSCQKTVTDFSMMTDKEILSHLSKRDADVCGRFTVDQLDRTLIGEHKKKFSWAYVWNFVIATFLTVNYASAQQTPERSKKAVTNEKTIAVTNGSAEGEFSFVLPEGIRKIEGVVMDSKTNMPIPYVTISVKGTSSKVLSDENGKFSLNVMFSSDELVIEVSSVSYVSQSFTISKANKGKLSFYLDQSAEILGEVVVTGYPVVKPKLDISSLDLNQVVGLVIIREETPFTKKLDRIMDDWTAKVVGRKEMTIYPNPLTPGSSANVTVALKQTGDYTMEIIDTDGRIMHRQLVQINSTQQIISISTDASWSKGVYWVRMTGSDSKTVINSKLVLQ